MYCKRHISRKWHEQHKNRGGAFVFTYISIKIGGDPSRVAAQIASGVGFIGAGIIFKNGIDDIRHLTTAVLVWVLAALGSLISLGYLFESLMITGIIYIILKIKNTKMNKIEKLYRSMYENELRKLRKCAESVQNLSQYVAFKAWSEEVMAYLFLNRSFRLYLGMGI